ncbi:MAG: UDP-N-acetylglucosamine 2-epimerase (non-hydrolyzing) [Ignavibacteria bacterium]|nr:UDP-N-acetylglucosamine 2-epimerase (non-hydrolyzing) [Ignavibacteria bacterium]
MRKAKILTVVGARPQFIKYAVVSSYLKKNFREILVHSGQHYDFNMSDSFFRTLNIPKADYYLNAGSGSHAVQTARIMTRLENILLNEKPGLVIIFGDTNTTLAAAITASKLNFPVAHIEAGLRSFNLCMPEEINRICSDHVSKLLFCPTHTAVNNLKREGISRGVYLTGDIMKDLLLKSQKIIDRKKLTRKFKFVNSAYYFLTIHRQSNTRNSGYLQNLLNIFKHSFHKIYFPVHPGTAEIIRKAGIKVPEKVNVMEPIDYFESIFLQKNSKTVITDSGGVQKEAFMLNVPCITLRDETEWVETVKAGVNILIGSNKEDFIKAQQKFLNEKLKFPKNYYGDGTASLKIIKVISRFLSQ